MANKLLQDDLKAKNKRKMEYPFLSDSQLERRRSREVSFGVDFTEVVPGIFNRVDPRYGRKVNPKPKGERKYFYSP